MKVIANCPKCLLISTNTMFPTVQRRFWAIKSEKRTIWWPFWGKKREIRGAKSLTFQYRCTKVLANRPKCLLKSTNILFLTVLGYFWEIITEKGHFGPFLGPKKRDSGAKYPIFQYPCTKVVVNCLKCLLKSVIIKFTAV